jgi:hypothetical protein
MLWTSLRVSLKQKRILKVLVLGKMWSFFKNKTHKKREFLLLFVLTPTLFSVKNWPITKKITSAIPNDQNVGQTIFHHILIRIGGGNSKC